MKTPKEFSDNLKNNIITEEMLELALWSVNKRAKNWRDKKREYRGFYDKYHNYERCQEEETKMYEKKGIFLSLLKPICIHKEFSGYAKIRHFDYESDFEKSLIESLYSGEIVWSNYYISRDDYYFNNCYIHNCVNFFDTIDLNEPEFRYYLYYVIGNHSYHTPLEEEDIDKEEYKDLDIVNIDTLDTHGNDISDLVSVQFVDKLIQVIKNNNEINIDIPSNNNENILKIRELELKKDLSIESCCSLSREKNFENALYYWENTVKKIVKKNIKSQLHSQIPELSIEDKKFVKQTVYKEMNNFLSNFPTENEMENMSVAELKVLNASFKNSCNFPITTPDIFSSIQFIIYNIVYDKEKKEYVFENNIDIKKITDTYLSEYLNENDIEKYLKNVSLIKYYKQNKGAWMTDVLNLKMAYVQSLMCKKKKEEKKLRRRLIQERKMQKRMERELKKKQDDEQKSNVKHV